MKKSIVLICLILSVLLVLCSCGSKNGDNDESKVLETAVTGVETDGVTVTEDVAKSLLGAFSKEILGLEKEFGEYRLKLSATRVFDADGCLVEAFDGDSETPAGTFAIVGTNCFVYDTDSASYLILTPTGPQKVSGSNEKTSTTNESGFSYDEDNSEAIRKQFEKYTPEQIGFEKELTEYIFVMTTNTKMTEDGETAYVANVLEKDGTSSGYALAFTESHQYVYEVDTDTLRLLG